MTFREIAVGLISGHPAPPIVQCELCEKVYSNCKAYTDHRRAVHGLYYVLHSDMFNSWPPSPIQPN